MGCIFHSLYMCFIRSKQRKNSGNYPAGTKICDPAHPYCILKIYFFPRKHSTKIRLLAYTFMETFELYCLKYHVVLIGDLVSVQLRKEKFMTSKNKPKAKYSQPQSSRDFDRG